ncbi:MAG: 1-deoxy-D-xylulose-5-phosphate reductoisomerase, partial [Bacteroidales bacterium]|nr:1-deoxy-D-xylulose-5-phosphate reductoisomerase [Bacteroidales bacterium]
ATLMNKGLEAIEAKWLFNLEPDQIDIVVHPQSIIHSMVQFVDGSVKAQMGMPDMRLPILFALNYPGRSPASFPRLDFREINQLNFSYPDKKKFPNLNIALKALRQGGNIPCVMNAANEVAVTAFLQKKISFTGMPEVIERTIGQASYISDPGLEDYFASDLEARKIAESIVSQFMRKI